MNILVSINGQDVTADCKLSETRLSFDSSKRVTTAEITVMGEAFSRIARYDYAHYDQNRYSIAIRELFAVVIRDGRDGSVLFNGQIFGMEMDQTDAEGAAVFFKLKLNDLAYWLDRSVCWDSSFELQGMPASDQYILLQLLGRFCAPVIIVDSQNIQPLVPVIYSFDWKNKTCRQVLDDMCALSMAEWRVAYDGTLYYGPQGAAPAAPFALSTSPDGVTSFKVKVSGYSHDYSNPITRAFVRGGTDATGLTVEASYSDPVAVQEFGDLQSSLVDEQIVTAWDAALRAKSLVLQYAYPIESGNFTVWGYDWLKVGMLVHITEDNLGIEGDFIIRQLVMQWETDSLVRYEAQFGAAQADLVTILRLMEQRARWKTSMQSAGQVAPGSVTDASIAPPGLSAGSIQSVNANTLIGLISANQISTVNAGSIVGAITSTQIGSVQAQVIQGAIQSGQIGSVNAGTIQGVVVSSQLADGIIDQLGKYANALRPVPMLQTVPSLPNDNYLPGSFFYYVPDGHFYQITPDGMSWTRNDSPQNSVMQFYHIGAISAGSIVGLIVAAQIQSITAGQITGSIQAGQIGAVNASTIVGQLTATQISTVNASAIQGSIQAGQISTVNASAIQGTISAGQISSVNASTISGTIQGSQIANINAGTITIGQLTDSQIANVAASKLMVGTAQAYTVTVLDSNNQQIGRIGNLGPVYGGWFKVFGAGGSGYSDAKVNTDTAGNLSINDAAVTITNAATGTSLTTGPQTFDSKYSSVKLQVTGGSDSAMIVSRGCIVKTDGNYAVTVNRSPTDSQAGEVVVYRFGTLNIWLNGSTGICRADGGFQVGQNAGINTAVQVTATNGQKVTLSWNGGMLYSAVVS